MVLDRFCLSMRWGSIQWNMSVHWMNKLYTSILRCPKCPEMDLQKSIQPKQYQQV